MSNETMQVARIHDYGGPEQIVIEQAPRPEPKAGEVLVHLKAAGVNPADWKARAGYMKQFMPLAFPWIPGLEGAGTIETVGSNVTTLKPGQAVLGPITNSYAEYAVASATNLFAKPELLSFEQAASVPVGSLTAWGAVIEEAQVQPGQRVLVHGGAGGVGLYAVQFARWKGAHVTATASAANADFLRSIGAEEIINYQTTRFEDVVKDVDAVIDTVGGELAERSMRVIRSGGVFVTTAGRVDPQLGQVHDIRATNTRRADVAKLQTVIELLQSKRSSQWWAKCFP